MNKLAIAGAIALAIIAPTACVYYSAAQKAATAPARVASRTLDTDNIIHNYELFFDINSRYDARLAQIRDIAPQLQDETDPDERARLRTEVNAIKATCRNLATDYNANSAKANRSLFRSNGLPETLSIEACETGVA